jgi:hypothetical protein
MDTDSPDPDKEALRTAEQLREDLELIADSELPFSYDAAQILEALNQAENEELGINESKPNR